MVGYTRDSKLTERYQQVTAKMTEILMEGLEGAKTKGWKEYGSEIIKGLLYNAGITNDDKRPLYLRADRYRELMQLSKEKEKLEKKLAGKFEKGRQ